MIHYDTLLRSFGQTLCSFEHVSWSSFFFFFVFFFFSSASTETCC